MFLFHSFKCFHTENHQRLHMMESLTHKKIKVIICVVEKTILVMYHRVCLLVQLAKLDCTNHYAKKMKLLCWTH